MIWKESPQSLGTSPGGSLPFARCSLVDVGSSRKGGWQRRTRRLGAKHRVQITSRATNAMVLNRTYIARPGGKTARVERHQVFTSTPQGLLQTDNSQIENCPACPARGKHPGVSRNPSKNPSQDVSQNMFLSIVLAPPQSWLE